MRAIPVVLETLSITRVGATGIYYDYSAADIVTYKLPLQLDSNTQLYYVPAIPATSFKGVLRSTYERYLRKEKVSEGEKKKLMDNINNIEKLIENVTEKETVRQRLLDTLKEELALYSAAMLVEIVDPNNIKEALMKYFEVTGYGASKACYVTSELDHCMNVETIEDTITKGLKILWNKITGRDSLCNVCKVFGTTGVRGYVKFTDLVAVDPFPVLFERLTHNAINRVTGTAETGKLFNEEVIPAGVKFLGFLVVMEDSKKDEVLEALRLMKEKAEKFEIWIGGRGTSGYGSFRLYIPGDVVKFSKSSLFGSEREIKLEEKEAKSEVTVEYNPVLFKFFPRSLLATLTEIKDTEKWYELVVDNQAIRVNTPEELEAKIKELQTQGKKFSIRMKGVVNL
ncbi:RAMP superfamily CRISPR-associated protein [Sulfolobus sp. E11-6]|uniref:RAMP superfamily CRISPR-associated protein n=1 Tax=Sulfolobus sp. E11-6 TaxID=2663020 RepID=UPI001297D3DA|nr:RAMP superfamily CRISPR-associated protein [Sulfolobus sp. E11-6]QGA68928.1 hypothetical protein GFS33_09560 [Sulfolobus sp. E11-6]